MARRWARTAGVRRGCASNRSIQSVNITRKLLTVSISAENDPVTYTSTKNDLAQKAISSKKSGRSGGSSYISLLIYKKL